MVKTTLRHQTPEKAIQLILRGIRFVSECLERFEHRATKS